MCVNPIQIYNTSKYLAKDYNKPFKMFVPCGKCCECKANKKAEYSLRSYYEAKSCFLKNGFILFDTLTYNPKYRPKISDHYKNYTYWDHQCFNRRHVVLFLKQLRVWLERDGYNVGDNLRYFLTSEYGLDARFSHAPHYHVLFYVTFNIDPLVLSRYISLAWPYGRTDGVLYHGASYVLEKRVFRSFDPHSLATVNYVAKYVSKNSIFDRKILYVLFNVFNITLPTWQNHDWSRKEFSRVARQVNQFHAESKDFGSLWMIENNVNDIVNNGCLHLPVPSKNVIAKIPITSYFKRKLFYKQIYFNGSRVWIPNELGFKYLPKLYERSKIQFELKFDDFINSGFLNSETEREIRPFKYVLSDYVFYKRGRIKSEFPEFGLDIYKSSIAKSSFNYNELISCDGLFYNYGTHTDFLRFGKKFVSLYYLGNSSFLYDKSLPAIPINFSNPVKFNYKYVIDQSRFYELYCFHDDYLDWIYDLFNSWIIYVGSLKQSKKDEAEYLSYLMAKAGIKTRKV